MVADCVTCLLISPIDDESSSAAAATDSTLSDAVSAAEATAVDCWLVSSAVADID